jgi:hypothetical protein
VQTKYDGQVKFVGVAGRDELAPIQDFVADLDVGSFPHVVDDKLEIWGAYGVRSQPTFAFLNDDGTVEVRGGSLGVEGLGERIEELIAS